MNKYQVFQIQFQSALQFSGPEKQGLDAMAFSYPAGANYSQVEFSVMFILYPAEAREAMQMSDPEFLEYARITFLANGGMPDDLKLRKVDGRSIEFQVTRKAIPMPGIQEAGIIALPDGYSLVIGFDISEKYSKEEAEALVTEVLESLEVV
jgi:hypothetical protein